ncbi:MFS transporter [Rhizobium sp. NZLR1b]|uniref:MFS transporter n=1 Tax=Rhizobium sp. NZLR1b TaxID=2731099 RepID=UPI001C82F91E|nr:MFS transporter [Rhizobium sp. NZLR1b]
MVAQRSSGMSPLFTLLFAVTGGAAVGNLYWSQPLLTDIAGSFGVQPAAAGGLVTMTQLGYATGVVFIVPLGDVLDRRRLIPGVMFLSALGLGACALAPTFAVLCAALAFVGLTTVSGQLLVPLAGDLAGDEVRGRVIGTVVSGMLIGILLSRTLSGLVGGVLGWRAIYCLAAIVTLIFAAVLARRLPSERTRGRVQYGDLLRSILTLVATKPAVRATLAIGACAFMVFTMFWTGLTFLLSAAPFSYSPVQIGLFGIAGVAGALVARRAGVLHDRGLSVPATGAALCLALVSLSIAGLGGQSVAMIVVAIILLDVAIQGINVLNQNRLLAF